MGVSISIPGFRFPIPESRNKGFPELVKSDPFLWLHAHICAEQLNQWYHSWGLFYHRSKQAWRILHWNNPSIKSSNHTPPSILPRPNRFTWNTHEFPSIDRVQLSDLFNRTAAAQPVLASTWGLVSVFPLNQRLRKITYLAPVLLLLHPLPNNMFFLNVSLHLW